MLTSRATATEMQNLLDFLVESQVALYANPVLDRQGLVTWRSARSASPLVAGHGPPSVLDYRHWLSNGEYSAILYDGAILQMSYIFAGRELTGHRLAYIPCPYKVDAVELLTYDLAELLETYEDCMPSDIVLVWCLTNSR